MFRVKGAAGFAGLGGHLWPRTPDPCLLPGMAHLLLIFGSLCLGPQLKKSPSCAVSGNLLPAKELFLALFGGTQVLLLQIYRRCQHHHAAQQPSCSAPLISCFRKAFLKLHMVFPFLCMKPQLLFVLWFSAGHCCDVGNWRHDPWSRIGDVKCLGWTLSKDQLAFIEHDTEDLYVFSLDIPILQWSH